MTQQKTLSELRQLYERRNGLDEQSAGQWLERVTELVARVDPERADVIVRHTHVFSMPGTVQMRGDAWHAVLQQIREVIATLEAGGYRAPDGARGAAAAARRAFAGDGRPPASTQLVEADQRERLRYPIGRFQPRAALAATERRALIDEIARLPADARAAIAGLSDAQLDTPYRPGGWSVRQLVHHLPDSHLQSYVRFKLAVTEWEPTIKPYDEAAWAELADARGADVAGSLLLLEALHRRWTHFLASLEPAQFERAFRHPELGRVTLATNLQLYAWHGRHHVAHITHLREREGWQVHGP